MNDGFEYLHRLGAQKVFENTHIAKKYVQYILDKDYSKLSKVQLLGFLSILQREYSIDLSAVKEEYLAQNNTDEIYTLEETPVFISPAKNQTKARLIKILASIVLFVIIFFMFSNLVFEEKKIPIEINNTEIDIAKVNIEKNSTNKKNSTTLDQDEQNVYKLNIIPKAKVWIGIVDLDTYKQKQIVTSKKLELDPKKSYLLVFGHSYVDIEYSDEIKKFKNHTKLRLLYEDSTIKVLSKAEFKSLNRGRNW